MHRYRRRRRASRKIDFCLTIGHEVLAQRGHCLVRGIRSPAGSGATDGCYKGQHHSKRTWRKIESIRAYLLANDIASNK